LNPNVKAHQNPSTSGRLQRTTANFAGNEFASFAAAILNVETRPGNIEVGSTNVYADLGYADAAEMQRKSQLAAEIARAIKARRLTQGGAAELLGIDQSKVSRITRGQFRGVSEAKLLELVAKLGRDIKIVVGPMRRRVGKIELQFVPRCAQFTAVAQQETGSLQGAHILVNIFVIAIQRLGQLSHVSSAMVPDKTQQLKAAR
jgi:predicted XRE-type DNA-binding protein